MKFDNLKIQVFYWSREWALSEDLKRYYVIELMKTRRTKLKSYNRERSIEKEQLQIYDIWAKGKLSSCKGLLNP